MGSDAGRVHGEDTGSAANIEDNLVFEEVGVLVDRVTVASCADFVLLCSLSVFVSSAQTQLGLPAFPRGCLYSRISIGHMYVVRENEPWWL